MELKKRGVPVWFLILVCVLVAVSGWFPPVLAVLPGLAAAIGVAGKRWQIFAGFVVSCAVILLLNSLSAAAYIAGLFFPTTIVLSVLLRSKKVAYSETALVCAALMTLGIYAAVCLPSFLETGNAFGAIQNVFYETRDRLMELGPDALGITEAELAGISSSISWAASEIPGALTAFVCAVGALCGLFSFLIAQRIALAYGAPVRRAPKFIRWRLPGSHIIGFLILLVGCVIWTLCGMEGSSAIWTTVAVVIALPLVIQGLSTVWFLLHRRQAGALWYIVLVILIVVLLPYAVSVLTVIGILEQAFRIRNRMEANQK